MAGETIGAVKQRLSLKLIETLEDIQITFQLMQILRVTFFSVRTSAGHFAETHLKHCVVLVL